MATPLEQIIDVISDASLSLRGAFHPAPDDGVAADVGTVVLVGNIGNSMWSAFEAGRRDEPDAMDSWTRRTLNEMLSRLTDDFGNVTAIHPSDGPPYHPFQHWAMRGECVHPSPIGPLIHAEYGMWHAYRGALMFQQVLELPAHVETPNPCDTCADKPCLNTCPVGAFTEGAYDTTACANHLTTPEGDECLTRGCLARRACPVGQQYAHTEAQARFHMSIFRDKYVTC